jgi:acetolactate synthase small subunit
LISIFNYRKNYFKKQFQKQLIEADEKRVVSDKEIKTVGILTTELFFNTIELKEEVERVLNLRNAKIYCYRPYKKSNTISYKHFSEKDFNWKGKVIQPNFNSFIEEPFDLLIGFFDKSNLFLESAVLQSKSTFKVGIAKVNQMLYDIEIKSNPYKVEEFLTELKKYLILIEKIKN